MKRTWFINKDFTLLEIKKFRSISEHQIESAVVIHDVKAIQRLAERIERIPPDGDKMISFSSRAAQIDLLFHSKDQLSEIQFFSKQIKTPSTGFNSVKSEFEIDLYNDIDTLLFPGLKKKILFIENLELDFKDFSITWTGSEFHDAAPVSVSFTKQKFLLKDKYKNEQIVEIISGQRPPQPLTVKISDLEITILTYKTGDAQQLYPNYFQIVNSERSV